MHRSPIHLRYHHEDRALRTVEELSRHGQISCGFIRLCLVLGCPVDAAGRLSLAVLLDWLCLYYPAVRSAAGLLPLPSLANLAPSTASTLQMGNAMITLLQYAESRASSPAAKRRHALMLRCVERSLDC